MSIRKRNALCIFSRPGCSCRIPFEPETHGRRTGVAR